jgi:hypothetical protein
MTRGRISSRFARLGAAGLLAAMLTGCAGADVQIDAPILEAAGINLTSKPPPEPDLEEKPPLVVPPNTESLPKPGERQVAAAEQQWPEDPDKIAKRKEEQAEKEREEYCREGDWSGDAGIEEFDKNMGREQRCPSKLGEALSETLGGGSASE